MMGLGGGSVLDGCGTETGESDSEGLGILLGSDGRYLNFS